MGGELKQMSVTVYIENDRDALHFNLIIPDLTKIVNWIGKNIFKLVSYPFWEKTAMNILFYLKLGSWYCQASLIQYNE